MQLYRVDVTVMGRFVYEISAKSEENAIDLATVFNPSFDEKVDSNTISTEYDVTFLNSIEFVREIEEPEDEDENEEDL